MTNAVTGIRRAAPAAIALFVVLLFGPTVSDAQRTLFALGVFGKVSDGTWKIARYCFCTTNPPPE
jgi:hypothetical protein